MNIYTLLGGGMLISRFINPAKMLIVRRVIMDVNLFPTVASIMAICFLVGLFCKNRKLDTWIPCIVGTVGGILGVVGLFVIPEFPAGNVMDAIAVGIVSGLSATGAHQIFKQLSSKDSDKNNDTPAAPADVNYTWDEYQADKGRIAFLANKDETDNGQS